VGIQFNAANARLAPDVHNAEKGRRTRRLINGQNSRVTRALHRGVLDKTVSVFPRDVTYQVHGKLRLGLASALLPSAVATPLCRIPEPGKGVYAGIPVGIRDISVYPTDQHFSAHLGSVVLIVRRSTNTFLRKATGRPAGFVSLLPDPSAPLRDDYRRMG
jgi:hypothetical protein